MTPPPDRDLSPAELRDLAVTLAADMYLWAPFVAHDPDRRIYHPLLRTDHASAWLICWMPGHDTGFHDHDGAAGAVAVVRGRIREERLRLGAPPMATEYAAGGVLTFGPADIHRVRHAGDEPAVTVHAYSPRLRRMGAYVEAPDGVLLRHALDEDDELRAA
jgi:predicted metal-dependent enzyme (double-stranded beta helix superfamily)